MDQLVGSALSRVGNWIFHRCRRVFVSPEEDRLMDLGRAVEQRTQIKTAQCRIQASTYLDRRAGRRVS